MSNSGKWLEQLVAEIEKTLLPANFTVATNEKIFNDDGVQIAEFDIVIEGNLGSTSIRWLIECRDRPSEGTAPGEWISGLIGRRDFHLFDKVTAVSTTGFSPSSIEYAKGCNIDLRTVENLALESISDWFGPTEFSVIENCGILDHAELLLDSKAEHEAVSLAIRKFENLDVNALYLIHTETGNALSIRDAQQDVLNKNPSLFKGLKLNGEAKKATIVADYRNPESRYQVATEKGAIHIVQIKYHAVLSIKTGEISVAKITQYAKALDKKPVAQSVHFEIEIGDSKFDLAFRNFGQKDKTRVSVLAKPSDETQKHQ